jgi:hypothetical protein
MSSSGSICTPGPTEHEAAILLVEYQAAQSSAQHHDSMLWTATYIFWGAILVLLGFGVTAVEKATQRWVVQSICVLGVVLTWAVESFARDFRSIKNQKYARCKAIEERLQFMRQHRDTKTATGRQALIYYFVTVLFTGAWLVLFLASIAPK